MKAKRWTLAATAALLWLSVHPADAQPVTWIDQVGTVGDDSISSIATVPSGGIVAARNTTANFNQFDVPDGLYLHRYAADGTLLWTRYLVSRFGHVVADAAGNLYIGGLLAGPDTSFVMKLDPAGNDIWEIVLSNFGVISNITIDQVGGIYVSGNQGSSDFLRKIDQSGNTLWHVPVTAGTHMNIFDMATDPVGNTTIVGTRLGSPSGTGATHAAIVIRHGPDGVHQWTKTFDDLFTSYAYAVWADQDGNAYVAAQTVSSLVTQSWTLHKYAPDGTALWERPLPSVDGVLYLSVAGDGSGGVFLAGGLGVMEFGQDVFIARYSGEGNPVWGIRFGTSRRDMGTVISPDRFGGFYVGGFTDGAFAGEGGSAGLVDAFVARFSGPSCAGVAGQSTAHEGGPVSYPIHAVVEPVAGPLGPTVHTVNCTVIAPLGL